MKVFCVRIGDKYGPEYEAYIEAKLAKYEVCWIRETFHPRVQLQWNKMLPMSLDIDEPVCVIDIDLILINDYERIFEFPIKRGQFVGAPDWWRSVKPNKPVYTLNGGFFKYYPRDCRYIYDIFMANITPWQNHYIQNGTTTGPVNGEQYFVEDMVSKRLELVLFPDEWITRWASERTHELSLVGDMTPPDIEAMWNHHMNYIYRERTGNPYLFLGDEFHPDIKMVHFTSTINKPHEWSGYGAFANV